MERFSRFTLLGATLLFLTAAAFRQDAEPIDLRKAYAGPVSTWPKAEVDPGVDFVEFGPLPAAKRPEGVDAQRVALGARLFSEPRLSASGQFACASCHNRELGFGDGVRTSFGHDRQRGQRNAISLFTAGYMRELFWDGRSPTLEHQALQPIPNLVEMAAKPAKIEHWINSDDAYRAAFKEAYGVKRIKLSDVAQAIASFERTLRPPASAWDRVFTRGTASMTDQQLQGLHLFRTKARCANCHNGPLLTDQKYHNLGISFYGRRLEDVGRYGVTHDPVDVGRFRTAPLRALRRTGPYMHNGIFPSLEGVVNLYAAGGGVDRKVQSGTTKAPPPQPDPQLKKLALTPEERAALVAFLEML
jgi:cytochrome c peroxidase